jgi:hypothetical protein
LLSLETVGKAISRDRRLSVWGRGLMYQGGPCGLGLGCLRRRYF